MRFLTFLAVIFQCTLYSQTALIIDTDGDIDDLISIAMLMNCREFVDVKGITTTLFEHHEGSSKIEPLLGLITLLNREDLPVSFAVKGPLSPFHEELPSFWTYHRKQSSLGLPTSKKSVSFSPSHRLLANLIIRSPGPVSVLCIAPLTNLAYALRDYPEIKEKIEHVYVMGGAVDVPGNIGHHLGGYVNKFAEYNLVLDVEAADEVLHAGLPITLVPLDASHKVPLVNEIYRGLITQQKRTPLSSFVLELIEPFVMHHTPIQGYFLDIIAASLVVDRTLGTYQNAKVLINTEPGSEYGRLILHRRGAEVEICTDVNTLRLFNRLISILQK